LINASHQSATRFFLTGNLRMRFGNELALVDVSRAAALTQQEERVLMESSANDRKPAALPAPNSDFYELVETLPAEELAVVKQVGTFMETKIAPIITKYWVEDAFPFEILPALKELNIGGVGMQGYGCRGGSAQLFGLVAMEMARVDSSIATFFGVHNGLAMGSI
jgi:alkylation response protein AidB-like acyl-CoA dehydrogenase